MVESDMSHLFSASSRVKIQLSLRSPESLSHVYKLHCPGVDLWPTPPEWARFRFPSLHWIQLIPEGMTSRLLWLCNS